ncbi:MAG: glycosyltransferase [Eubacteriaceae bacterium]|nr:glycosyltransferase [Eubacteriaceae bacterium]
MDRTDGRIINTVSVAMAAYNGEKFIKPQIESIISQLRSCDELVISYDKSTDRTYEILMEYSQKYPIVKIVNDPGSCVFSNFENAIRNTTKDIVFISDQDDIWTDEKLNKVLEVFENSTANMVIHNGVHINAVNEVVSENFFSMHKIRKGIIRNFIKPRYSGCCIAFKKELKELIIPIPRGVGAYDHWIGMIGERYGNVVFMDDILLRHRLHDDNVTVSRRDIKTIIKARFTLMSELIRRKKARK